MATPKLSAGIPAAAIAAEIDELGEIGRRLAPHRLDLVREEALRKAIRAHFDESPAEKPYEAAGAKFTALIGARASQKAIDILLLIKRIGLRAFAKFAKVSLGDLDDNVSVEIYEEVVSSRLTGPRSLRVFETGAAK